MSACRRAAGSGCGPGPTQEVVAAAEQLLAALPGIVAVRRVDGPILGQAAAQERRGEHGGILPVRNLGMQTALERQVVFALLKARSFRPPPAPTVYLVEELEGGGCGGTGGGCAAGAGAPPGQLIRTGDRSYRILGEEVLSGRDPYTEKTVKLSGSFVMFPERRTDPRRPSYFLVPALGFAELEEAEGRLGIRGVFSISPSASTDALLRELCGFDPDPGLATLLVGFDCL